MKKAILFLALLIGFTTACTPEEISIWHSLDSDSQAAVLNHVANSNSGTVPDICQEGKGKNVTNCAVGWDLAQADGYSVAEFQCLDFIVMRESAWHNVPNKAGGRAYGIPQALPGSKMASHGKDWATNVKVQIAWMLDYIDGRYGAPCKAKSFKVAKGWY